MSRRRPTFAAYVRRRWRALGAIVVLLLGSLLMLAVTDRGHDPLWEASLGELDQAAVAPDASAIYALLREAGNISRLQARAGERGDLLWESDVNATGALLAAGPGGAAVATDFPLAFLTFYGGDGDILWQVPLEGNPVALVIDGPRLALALDAPGNPVLLYEDALLLRTHRLPSPVRALDLEAGFLATGGLAGELHVFREDHRLHANVTLPMSIRSVRIAQDGTALVAGGFGLSPSDPRGHVALLDLQGDPTVRWSHATPFGVGLVDVDAAGLRAVAVEESPPRATIHVYEGATGATSWTNTLRGSVWRDDAGTVGGAAIAPQGEGVAVATLRGDVRLLDIRDGTDVWSYRAGGATVVSFSEEAPDRFLVGGRLLESRPFDSLFLFSLEREPLVQQATVMAFALVVAGALSLSALVGLGYWRARRAS